MKTRLLRRASIGTLALTLLGATAAVASDVDVAVVDVTVPNSAVTLAPGSSGAITINLTVTGSQAGTATFEVYRNWTLSGGTFAGSNPQEFTVPPRAGGAPATTFSTTGTVSAAAGQTPGTFTLAAGAFDITNSNSTGGKLAARNSSQYVVTVAVTNTAPSITVNAATLEGNTLGGRTLSFTDIGTATDAQDATPPSVTCSPALGSVLPLGMTTVTCTATDSADATASASGVITVVDTVPPSLANVPTTATLEATSSGGATHGYTPPTATDIVWGSVTTECAPASGSVFPLGATTVTCTATDGSSNTATALFAVNVQDTTAPIITATDVKVEGNTLGGADVIFSTPTATDAVDGGTVVTCDRQSATFFPLGTTTVTCTSTDSSDNASEAAFVVTVEDTTAPVITTSDVSVEGNTTGGANASFPMPTATDVVDGSTPVTCDFDSGDFFPLGSTTVTCASSDASGNSSPATFEVEVVDTTAPSLVGMPTDVTLEGTTWGGTIHPYTAPTAADVVDPGASVSCTPPPGFFALGSNTVTCTATDASGNSSSDSFTVKVVDTTEPTISYVGRTPDANGNEWNTTDVTVSWNCTDGVSGVVSDTVAKTVTTEGQNQSATGTCEDNSGNTASDTAGGINIDKTAPTLGVSGATSGAYTACSIPTRPSFAPADGLSGIAPTPSETWATPSTASGVGTYTYTATATDQAGNTTTETRTYSVTYGASLTGFLQPINNDGTSRFKLGSTVPAKFQLSCGGVPVTSAVAKLTVKRADSNPDPGTDEALSTAASTTGNLFRYSDSQYIFNLSTKAGYTNPGSTTPISFTQGSWTISALLDDGTFRSVNIQLVK